jgi:hypothetical protein
MSSGVENKSYFNPLKHSGYYVYCNGFAQSVSRQGLGKHVPMGNNGQCISVDECYTSLLNNSQRANELAG